MTLQDRLVKELRLQGSSTIEAANAYVPKFIADFNRRFAKPPRNDWNAHRPLQEDEDLDLVLTVCEQRKVSHVLTLQYDKTIYLLGDTKENRKLIGRYLDVYDYPDGRIELRADGAALAHTTYERMSEVNQGAIVGNKRLGHVLQVVQQVKSERDNRRSQSVATRTNMGLPPRRRKFVAGKKTQRQLNAKDVEQAIKQVALASAVETNSAVILIEHSAVEAA